MSHPAGDKFLNSPERLAPPQGARPSFMWALVILAGVAMGTVACLRSDEKPAEAKAETTKAAPTAPTASKAAYEKRWEEREFKPVASSCYNCHETLARANGRPAREHITSAHFRAAVTCHECHGGNPKADEHDMAHDEKMGFIGKLDAAGMLDRCGKCHQHEVTTFKASKHFPEHQGVRQVTCFECHGAHDIGARPPTFSWTANCAQCHDLEAVPDLPAELVAVMKGKDTLQARLRDLRIKNDNKPFDPKVMDLNREVRQKSADIVHATRAKEIGEETAQIVAKEKSLEDLIAKSLGQ